MFMRDQSSNGDETVARRILRPALRYVFGDDFFITYGRADGAAYAAALANRLVGAGYTCYLDQWQPIVDADIPMPVRRALLRASTQIVVGSLAATRSKAVALEVALFSETGRPITPIDFSGTIETAPWWDRVRGLARSNEETESLAQGAPSAAVLDRLINTFQFRRRSRRIRTLFGAFAVGSSVLAGVSLLSAKIANDERVAAATATVEAKHQAQAAKTAASAAESERARKEEVTRQLQVEEKRAVENARRAEEQAAMAERRGLLADSRALAITSRTATLAPDQRLLLAVESWRRDSNDEARGALSSALLEVRSLVRVLYSPSPQRTRAVVGAGLSANGQLALAGYSDGTLLLWQLTKGSSRLLAEQGPSGRGYSGATATALSNDAGWAAVGYSDGALDLVRIVGSRIGARRALNVSNSAFPISGALRPFVSVILFAPDGKNLVAGWSDGRLQAFSTETDQRSSVFGIPFDSTREYHRLGVLGLARSRDGRWLASSHGGGVIRLWHSNDDFQDGGSISTEADATSLAFDHESKSLYYAGGASGGIRVLRVQSESDAPARRSAEVQQGAWSRLSLVGGSPVLAMLSASGAPWLATLSEGQLANQHLIGPASQHSATALASAHDVGLIIVGYPDGTLSVFNVSQEALAVKLEVSHSPWRIVFDSSGEMLFGVRDLVTVWNTRTLSRLVERRAPWDPVHSQILALKPMSRSVIVHSADLAQWSCDSIRCDPIRSRQNADASAGAPQGMSVWQGPESRGAWQVRRGGSRMICDSNRCIDGESATGELNGASTFALAADGKQWAYATAREVRLCRAAHCDPIPGLEEGSDGWIGALFFSPDSHALVVGTSEGRTRFVDTATRKELVPARTAHTAGVTRIAFNPSGTRMASGGRDGTVVIWDMESYRPIGEALPRPGIEQVSDLAVSPTSDQVAALYTDGSIRMYDLRPESLVELACSIAGRSISAGEWLSYGGGGTCKPVCGQQRATCLVGDVRASVHR